MTKKVDEAALDVFDACCNDFQFLLLQAGDAVACAVDRVHELAEKDAGMDVADAIETIRTAYHGAYALMNKAMNNIMESMAELEANAEWGDDDAE